MLGFILGKIRECIFEIVTCIHVTIFMAYSLLTMTYGIKMTPIFYTVFFCNLLGYTIFILFRLKVYDIAIRWLRWIVTVFYSSIMSYYFILVIDRPLFDLLYKNKIFNIGFAIIIYSLFLLLVFIINRKWLKRL